MSQVRSSDGTTISYDKAGEGPALILVDGALCSRAMGPMPKLAAHLADHFTVYTYDRRGRGESGDTQPYALEREVEDVQALVAEAGGSAYLFGASSGGVLALETAKRTPGIDGVAVYEAPFVVDDSREPMSDDYPARLQRAVDEGRRGDAVKMFMKFVGTPGIFIALMRPTPIWRKLEAVAHTLPYDIGMMAEHQRGEPLPKDRWSSVNAPTFAIAGGKSPTWMKNAQRALAGVLPSAAYRELAGQTHMVKAKVVAPVLIELLGSGERNAAATAAAAA